jgi:hypothetical protein
MQSTGIEYLFNEITAEKSSNIGKDMEIQVQDSLRTPNRNNQKRISPHHIIVKISRL